MRPSEIAGSYSFGRRLGSWAVTSSVATVDSTANSIVTSNMMIRLGHVATIRMPPVGSGHARSVIWVSQ